ncbi:putative inactive receptor kinase [Drosera capensis]
MSLTALVRLDLSGNRFEGQIPFELNDLKDLTGLFLQRNNFTGELPSIDIEGLVVDFNVSENGLSGSIPGTLRRFPASSFEGNLELCGPPLAACNTSPSPSPTVPSSPAQQSKRGLSTAGIVGIAVAGFVFILFLLILLVLCLRKRSRPSGSIPPKIATATARGAEAGGTSSSKDDMTSGGGIDGERNKLVFLDDNAGGGGGGGGGSTSAAYRFDLEDLLRASAEVLGKGSMGTSYKAVLEEGTAVVVKRLKEVVAGKREFEAALEVLGRCRHDNVVAPKAYYYSKDEKLLVLEHLPAGSLSALLHGSRGSGRTPLDWESRVRVSLATAKALTYLHVSNIIHGNIKASNILLRSSTTTSSSTFCVSDFGLNPLFGTASPPNRIAGYRAPEVLEIRKVTPQSDVYSFGVLLLELLTGKAPNQASLGDEGIDLPRWVQSVVREEWTAEVFDVELMRYNVVEDEMVQLLQVAMACVAIAPDQRPAMPEVLRMIEEVSRGESATDDGMRQSSDEPSKGSDGHTPPAETRTP